jgi:hypothetical protein
MGCKITCSIQPARYLALILAGSISAGGSTNQWTSLVGGVWQCPRSPVQLEAQYIYGQTPSQAQLLLFPFFIHDQLTLFNKNTHIRSNFKTISSATLQ